MTDVTHYGIHREAGFAFLVERKRSQCLSKGFEDLPSPFTFKGSATCPHCLLERIGIEPLIRLPRAKLDHPLLQAMLPRENAAPGAYYVPPSGRGIVEELQRLSMNQNPIASMWFNDAKRIVQSLMVTNISPIVVVNYDMSHAGALRIIANAPRLRPVIFCGQYPPAGEVTELSLPDFDVGKMPLGQIGWQVLQESVQ